jgi:hypothetical protein
LSRRAKAIRLPVLVFPLIGFIMPSPFKALDAAATKAGG